MKKNLKKNNIIIKKHNKNKNKIKKKKLRNEKNNKNSIDNKSNTNNNYNIEYINKTCFICFNEMDNNNRIILRCNHCLCKFCYKSWAKIKDTCPMCRQLVITKPSEDPCFEDILRDMYNNRSYIFEKCY